MADIENSNDTLDVNIWDNDKTKAVDVTTDGGINRLEVGAKIEGGSFQLQQFNPVVIVDTAGASLSTGSWTTLANITSTQGKLDFIGISGSTSNYRVRVTIDSTEIFDLSMSDLNTLGFSDAEDVPIATKTANKNFRYRPRQASDFGISLLVEAQATSATPTVYTTVTYREVT